MSHRLLEIPFGLPAAALDQKFIQPGKDTGVEGHLRAALHVPFVKKVHRPGIDLDRPRLLHQLVQILAGQVPGYIQVLADIVGRKLLKFLCREITADFFQISVNFFIGAEHTHLSCSGGFTWYMFHYSNFFRFGNRVLCIPPLMWGFQQ